MVKNKDDAREASKRYRERSGMNNEKTRGARKRKSKGRRNVNEIVRIVKIGRERSSWGCHDISIAIPSPIVIFKWCAPGSVLPFISAKPLC